MAEPKWKLLLLIHIRERDDLLPVVKSADWHTIADLFRKTRTSYNTHWNGKYVLDQDEIPWNATAEEGSSLIRSKGTVVALHGMDYRTADKINLFMDADGSYYALEDDLRRLIEP